MAKGYLRKHEEPRMCADALSASRKQTESVAELRRGFVDDEGTVQMRAGGGRRFTEVPGKKLSYQGHMVDA